MSSGFAFIQERLAQAQAHNTYRQRVCVENQHHTLMKVGDKHYLNFSSNDYLGMRQSQTVLQAWFDGLCIYGGGSGASPLVTGLSKAHRALEDYLAEQLRRDKVLLFNSGFAANQAICQALCVDNTFHAKGVKQVIADKLVHASFVEGVQSTDARFKRFCHNDMSHLQQLIGDERGYLIASESIFSMDGDMAEVDALVRLAAQSDSWLMLDDAHGMGVLGDKGLGVAEHCNLTQDQLPVLMGTFGKAIGTAGAFIAGSEALIDYLINFSRHYIYSTAMPPAQATATLASLQHLVGGQARQQLADNIAYFKHLIKQSSWQLLPSASAIQPVLVGDEKRAVQLSQQLASLGIWATAIRSPTVPRGQARLRITLTSQHSRQDIAALVDALCLVEKDVA